MIVCALIPRLPLLIALRHARRPPDAVAALGPAPGDPQIIGTPTAAAAAHGIRDGLRVGEALARCPHLEIIPPDPAAVAAEHERLLSSLENIGAAVEAGVEGTAYFRAAGLERLYGGVGGVVARTRRALPVGLGGLVGGKLVRAASHGGVFFEGGLDALGVLLGGAFVLWLGGPRSRALAPRAASVGAMVAAAIGLGEHFGGARFGRVAESPTWLVVRHPRWPDLLGSPAWRAHLADGRIDEDAVSSLPTIPVGLLEAAVALVLFARKGLLGSLRERALPWLP